MRRVYLPARWADLAVLFHAGALDVELATAVTAALRADLPDLDEEDLELEALLDAAELSLARVAADPDAPRRRAVVAADLSEELVREVPDELVAGVRITRPVPLDAVVSVHVDEASAASSVPGEQVEDPDLLWYAPQEIAGLLEP